MSDIAIVSGKVAPATPEDLAPVVPARAPLEYSYDPVTDIFIVEGTKFAGSFFRALRTPERGLLMRITRKDDDGTVHLHIYRRGQTVFA